MKVKAKMNIIFNGKRIMKDEIFEIDKKDYERVYQLVDVLEEDNKTLEDVSVNLEKELDKKTIKKGKSKRKK